MSTPATQTTELSRGGNLYFAAWSPGAAEELTIKPPPFDLLLLGDTNSDGAISKNESTAALIKGFFDSIDANKDGDITKPEWEEALALVNAAKNGAFALQPGGNGDITETHVRWRKEKGLPYVSSAIVYGGQLVMFKDGGIVTAYDAASGEQLYQKRVAAPGKYYASPVAANGHIYLASLADGGDHSAKSGSDFARGCHEKPALGERLGATPAIADNTLMSVLLNISTHFQKTRRRLPRPTTGQPDNDFGRAK